MGDYPEMAVRRLVAAGEVRVSEHGYDELAEECIPVRDLLDGIGNAVVVEDYPGFSKGPAVLVLQFDGDGGPVHVAKVNMLPKWRSNSLRMKLIGHPTSRSRTLAGLMTSAVLCAAAILRPLRILRGSIG